MDGVRKDLEMHTVHSPKTAGSFAAAAMGIMFSVASHNIKVSEE